MACSRDFNARASSPLNLASRADSAGRYLHPCAASPRWTPKPARWQSLLLVGVEGLGFLGADWIVTASAAGLAALLSFLKSVAASTTGDDSPSLASSRPAGTRLDKAPPLLRAAGPRLAKSLGARIVCDSVSLGGYARHSQRTTRASTMSIMAGDSAMSRSSCRVFIIGVFMDYLPRSRQRPGL